MAQELFGSQHLFAIYSPWLLGVVLYATIMILVLLGRKIFEGRAYNVAYSSWLGGATLIGCMSIAGRALHRPDVVLPAWLASSTYHVTIAEISIMIGIFMGALAIYQTTWRESQVVDLAFNFLMAPAFIYGLVTLLPVTCFQGTPFEKTATVVLIVAYLVTAIIDIRTGRLHQHEWLEVNHDW